MEKLVARKRVTLPMPSQLELEHLESHLVVPYSINFVLCHHNSGILSTLTFHFSFSEPQPPSPPSYLNVILTTHMDPITPSQGTSTSILYTILTTHMDPLPSHGTPTSILY